ncbi:hypothetical protein [Altererythrobacter sp. GH1-8]|uniref:hypothetical protein n=1 Tax=Altererythrobacter sp. GH1-8 TaxID=3349333 RepID=UPI00374C97EC
MSKPKKLSTTQLHEKLLASLRPIVLAHSDLGQKPLEIDLRAPVSARLRVYMYNATNPPGGRTLGEYKIQLMVPGQKGGEVGNFATDDDRLILLVGYADSDGVFILWDAGLYVDFAHSRNVQVKSETVIAAMAGKIAEQDRRLRPRPGEQAKETVVACQSKNLIEGIQQRMELTRDRLCKID